MFYNNFSQNLNNNIYKIQTEIQNNNFNKNNTNYYNNNYNSNMFYNNMNYYNSYNNYNNNFNNLRNQNLYNKYKNEQINIQKKELHKLLYSPYTYEEDIPIGESIGLNRSKYDFMKNIEELTERYINYSGIDILVFEKTKNSVNNLKKNTYKLFNIASNTEYKKEVFESYLLEMNHSGTTKEINTILRLKNNIIKIYNKTLGIILRYPNLRKEIEMKTYELTNLCDNIVLYFMELINNFLLQSTENYVFKIIKANNKLIELEEKIVNYININANVLNLKNNSNNSITNNSNNKISTKYNENELENLLNKEIDLAVRDERLYEEIKKGEDLYRALEEDIANNLNKNIEKQKQIARKHLLEDLEEIVSDRYGELPENEKLIKINENYKKYITHEFKEAEQKQMISDDERRLYALKFGRYSMNNGRIVEESTGLRDIRDEFDEKLNNLLNHLSNNLINMDIVISNDIEKMLNEIIKSYKKLKNRSEKYVQIAKSLKYKKEVLSLYSMIDTLSEKEINLTIKLKKTINHLEKLILNKIKNSYNKEEAEKFKRKLENLTLKLTNCYDTAALNFSEVVEKNNHNIKDKNKYLDELLETNYTIVDLNKKTINYLKSIFDDYKNL